MSYDRILEILTQSLPASPGQRQKSDRLFFTEENWEYDPLVSTGYLYDFLHDSQPEQNRNLSPASDPLKTPVEVRVSVPSEGSAPALRITFRPSHTCPADYWESLAALSGAEYPLGLYIDLPEPDGSYSRWLLCSRVPCEEAISCEAYPCNYRLQWMAGELKSMWGVLGPGKTRFSGVRTGELFSFPEEIREIWLPFHEESGKLRYGRRLLLCAPSSAPLVFLISGQDALHPAGILKLCLTQDVFDPNTDRADRERGIFCADFTPCSSSGASEEGTILYSGLAPTLKVRGGYRILSVSFKDGEGADFSSWQALSGPDDISHLMDLRPCAEDGRFRVRFTGDESYLGRKITLCLRSLSGRQEARLTMEVTSL